MLASTTAGEKKIYIKKKIKNRSALKSFNKNYDTFSRGSFAFFSPIIHSTLCFKFYDSKTVCYAAVSAEDFVCPRARVTHKKWTIWASLLISEKDQFFCLIWVLFFLMSPLRLLDISSSLSFVCYSRVRQVSKNCSQSQYTQLFYIKNPWFIHQSHCTHIIFLIFAKYTCSQKLKQQIENSIGERQVKFFFFSFI